MAKKKVIDADIESLKKILKEKHLVFGTERSMDLVKRGQAKAIYLSSNCPEEIVGDVEQYKGDAEVIRLPIPNDELGTLCRKQFSISVLALPNE